MTRVKSWPKTLPIPSAQSWNSTTETHLLHRTKVGEDFGKFCGLLRIYELCLQYLFYLFVPLTQFRCTNFSAQFNIIRCFNNFFSFPLSADWDHQLKNKTKQKTNTIARKEKKNHQKNPQNRLCSTTTSDKCCKIFKK